MSTPPRVVFHLHCYQPPREDPWTGTVPVEPSAAPEHDWNARVTDECYRPLRAARVLATDGRIARALNTYRHISVDVGATLHRWLAVHARDVDLAIAEADRDAAADHDGHGAAIAQPYIHAILPLATERDRSTLVRWGIADFRRRFGRDPEGMWLPEAAVDVATLECLAAHGIAYTILGQHQAARVRTPDGEWHVAAGVLDPSRHYVANLPSGRNITICLYDGPLSHAVAFERTLLVDGNGLARACAARAEQVGDGGLVLVATDGETFGHHHHFGEMALARALDDLSARDDVTVGGLGAWVTASAPAATEVEIVSPSAWSCTHGVERWRADCGDVTGGEPHWNQRWRVPLRAMVDLLVARTAECYESAASELVDDPWAVRDAYGEVIDGDLAERGAFARNRIRTPDADDATVARLLGLLEMQRHVLFATSSCAWFFADCAGIETQITLHHTARAVELAASFTGVDLAPEIEHVLAPMTSNDPGAGDGATLWRAAREAAVTPAHVAAAWAALAIVHTDLPGAGRLRAAPRDVQYEGSVDAPLAIRATVDVTDEATGTVRTIAVHVDRRAGMLRIQVAPGTACARMFTASDLPADARVSMIDAAQRGVAGAIRAMAADPVRGFSHFAFLVDVLRDDLPDRLRWTAQNAVLAARDQIRPQIRARDDDTSRMWLADFDRTAELLGIATDV